jgi:chromosome segregation ATPase
MNAKKTLRIGCLLAATVIGLSSASAAGKGRKAAPETPLTAAGEKLLTHYSEMLTAMRAEIGKALPAIDEKKKDAFLKARKTALAAEAEASAKQAALDANKAPKGLLEQRKGWVSKSDKGIARAEEMLKQATTETARKAAQEELVKWQKDKATGLSELKKSQEAVNKAKIDEPKVTQAHQAAQEALARARDNELMAAKVLLTEVEPCAHGRCRRVGGGEVRYGPKAQVAEAGQQTGRLDQAGQGVHPDGPVQHVRHGRGRPGDHTGNA